MRLISGIFLLVGLSAIAGCCHWFQPDDRSSALQEFCKPRVTYSGTSFAFSGISIPLGSSTPLKIGNVEIKPEVIQQASEFLQILEQHRLTSCLLLVSMDPNASGYQTRLQDAMADDERTTDLALILTKAPDQMNTWLKAQSGWISGTIQQDQPAMSVNPTLSEIVTKFSNSSPGAYQQATPAGALSWTLDQDVGAGDCTLHKGSRLSIANGHADYALNVSTASSFSGDVWHETWYFYDKSGGFLGQISANDTGRFMPGAWHTYTDNVFISNPFNYNEIASIKWFGQC